jgi:Tfp pilus assembly protein PilN
MICINLLGVSKPKKGKRSGPAMPVVPSDGPSPVVLFVIVLIVVGGVVFYVNHVYSTRADQIATQMKKEEADAIRLAAIKARYEERQKEAAEYEARVRVIDELRSRQSGPVDLLNTIGTTVNNTEAVWLNSMTDAGATINVEGVALSANAVANLMTNLTKSGYFKTVEIKQTFQDEQSKSIQAFNFVLVCERAGQSSAKPQTTQAGKS